MDFPTGYSSKSFIPVKKQPSATDTWDFKWKYAAGFQLNTCTEVISALHENALSVCYRNHLKVSNRKEHGPPAMKALVVPTASNLWTWMTLISRYVWSMNQNISHSIKRKPKLYIKISKVLEKQLHHRGSEQIWLCFLCSHNFEGLRLLFFPPFPFLFLFCFISKELSFFPCHVRQFEENRGTMEILRERLQEEQKINK